MTVMEKPNRETHALAFRIVDSYEHKEGGEVEGNSASVSQCGEKPLL